MISSLVEASEFKNLVLRNFSYLDVRAPVEFQAGAIPGSVNLPILDDQERHEIGTLYKLKGQEAAVARGFELVSGNIKDQRLASWKKTLQADSQMLITCFRGGKRSQIAQSWLQEAGIQRPRLAGGYKAFRSFLLSELERLSTKSLVVISGATGSGKSLVIGSCLKFRPTVDLEAYAQHRGSAFGGYGGAQASQGDFENRLAAQLIRIESQADEQRIAVEDESRLVGRCAQPEKFFENLRSSPIVFIDESLDSRVNVTFQEYILNSELGVGISNQGLQVYDRYLNSLKAISKKLGGMKFTEIAKDLQDSRATYESTGDLESNKVWIEKLLRDYYDPLYFHSLEKRQPQVLFRGSRAEVCQWLSIKS